MNGRDRFLWVIVAGTVVLVIAGIVGVVLVGRQGQAFLPDDTPEGVTHNYFLALQTGDYNRAYGYLSEAVEDKPTASEFAAQLRQATYFREGEHSIRMRVETASQEGDNAWVDVTVSEFSAQGIFDRSEYTRRETVVLRRESGQWRIAQFFYPFWQWQWVNPKPVEPIPPP